MRRKQGKTPHLPEAVCFPKSKADAIAPATRYLPLGTESLHPWVRGDDYWLS